jgi:hypothetical protein
MSAIHVHGGPGYLFNSGGGYRITPTQQIDFHIGIGLNDNAPAYIFGMGYSIRLDGPHLMRKSRARHARIAYENSAEKVVD